VTPAVGALADVRSLRQCDGGFSVFVRPELALRLAQLAPPAYGRPDLGFRVYGRLRPDYRPDYGRTHMQAAFVHFAVPRERRIFCYLHNLRGFCSLFCVL